MRFLNEVLWRRKFGALCFSSMIKQDLNTLRAWSVTRESNVNSLTGGRNQIQPARKLQTEHSICNLSFAKHLPVLSELSIVSSEFDLLSHACSLAPALCPGTSRRLLAAASLQLEGMRRPRDRSHPTLPGQRSHSAAEVNRKMHVLGYSLESKHSHSTICRTEGTGACSHSPHDYLSVFHFSWGKKEVLFTFLRALIWKSTFNSLHSLLS